MSLFSTLACRAYCDKDRRPAPSGALFAVAIFRSTHRARSARRTLKHSRVERYVCPFGRGVNGPAQIRHFLLSSAAWVPAVFLTLLSGTLLQVERATHHMSCVATRLYALFHLSKRYRHLQCSPHESQSGVVQPEEAAWLGTF